MPENTTRHDGSLPAHEPTDNATPRLFLVRRPAAKQPDGEVILGHVERYLLSRLRAAKRLALPAFVKWYAIGFHSLLVARVVRQKGIQP